MSEIELEVERNIPIAEPENRAKYPLGKLGVGDSFFVNDRNARNRISAAISRYLMTKSAGDKKFVQRTVEGGVRVWRTE